MSQPKVRQVEQAAEDSHQDPGETRSVDATASFHGHGESTSPVSSSQAEGPTTKPEAMGCDASVAREAAEDVDTVGQEVVEHGEFPTETHEAEDSGEQVTSKTLRDLAEKQEWKCALTGRPLAPDSTTELDHVQPLSRGGEHVIGNVQLVCKDANRAKGKLTTGEFVALCAEVVDHLGS